MTPDEAIVTLAATEHLLVALDFDGTLSPLVDAPMDARMLPAARAALEALTATPATTVALVSGRSLADLRVIAEHGDESPIFLAGSHGAEHWVPGGELRGEPGGEPGGGPSIAERAERDRLRAAAENLVEGIPGAWIEPKEFGFAVHSRTVAAADRTAVHDTVDGLMVAEAPTRRRRTGHHIVEYAFRDVGKDAEVAWLRARAGATAVLFAGDDVTDEDALASLDAGDVGVRVGPGDTAASVRVDGIAELAALLVRLAHERSALRE